MSTVPLDLLSVGVVPWMVAGVVSGLPTMVFFIMVGLVVAMAGLSGFAAWRAWRLGSWVTRAAPVSAAQAHDGLAGVEGVAAAPPGGPLLAGLSGVPCCWYRGKVEEYVRSETSQSASNQWSWRVVENRSSERPFLLVDATGRCAVWPEGAEVYPTDRTQWRGSSRKPDAPPPARGRPGDRPMSEFNLVTLGEPTHRFRYTEECLYAGDPLYVVGWKTLDRPGGSAIDDETDESECLSDEADRDDDAPEVDAGEGPPVQLEQEAGLRSHLSQPPPGRGGLIVSALGRDATAALHRNGLLGAGLVAVLLLAVLVWMLVARAA